MAVPNNNLPFECLCVAVERARRVNGLDDGPWTVGVRDGSGELLASAMLESYAQVRAFGEAMEEFGFSHGLMEAGEDDHCCDFTFRLHRGLHREDADLLHA
jgi:hypothetical protein